MCANTDNYPVAADYACAPVRERDFEHFGADELRRTHNQSGSALFEVAQMNIHQVLHHSALALADQRHVDFEMIGENSELFAVANVLRDLRAVNDVLTGKTGNVRAGSADIFPFDDDYASAFGGERPRQILRPFTAAKNYKFIISRRCIHAVCRIPNSVRVRQVRRAC